MLWKALAEIYTMHSFAQLRNPNFSQNFAIFFLQNSANLVECLKKVAKFWQHSSKFLEKNVILELCKGVHCVDIGESFQTHIYLQNLASIQPKTSPAKCARDAVCPRFSLEITIAARIRRPRH